MADPFDKLSFRPGDPLRAADLQAIADAIRAGAPDVRGGPGIHVRKGARGQLQLAGLQPQRRYYGVANGNITKRSGTTPGTGSVTLYRYDGSALFSTGINLDVLNLSSTAMTSTQGIDSGQYCWVEEDEDGFLWVAPLECA